MAWFDTLLWPIKVVVAWIMVMFHKLNTSLFGMAPDSGLAWALSIVGLVVVIRILLIPLFVRQIKASRAMQMLSPELQAIQKKYKGKTDPASREAMSRETMALYSKHGTNPFSSCLPILAQSPIFFALFRVLYNMPALAAGTYPSAANPKSSIGILTQDLANQATNATIFGAKISSFFLQPDASSSTRTVTVVLIVLMSLTTFTTQRQLTQKNMPASAMTGPMAQQQKMLLYVLPLVFAFSGVNFPIGVLIYWTTTNLWSMGQQFYVIRRNPTPGSAAERELLARRARKAAAKGIVLEDEKPAIEEKPRGQRSQPKRKARDRPAPRPGDTGNDDEPGVAPTSNPADGVKPSGGSRQSGSGTGRTAPRAAGAAANGDTPETPRKPRRRPAADGSTPGSATTPAPRASSRAKPVIEPGAGAPGARSGNPRRRPEGTTKDGAAGDGRRPRSASGPAGSDGSSRGGATSTGGSNAKPKPTPKPETDADDGPSTPDESTH